MRYYIIAGEASGDLHAKYLMEEIRRHDSEAELRYWYRPDLAYMGFLPVLMHFPQILNGMKKCKEDIVAFRPDRLVLVDYPGFNLKIAKWFRRSMQGTASSCGDNPKVCYYIPPKIWAWKEGRIKNLRRDVDRILSILPFEVDWYREKHNHEVIYVGNPTLDEIAAFRVSISSHEEDAWCRQMRLEAGQRLVALMPGSRRQEVVRNLPMMLKAAMQVAGDYVFAIASAPNIDPVLYDEILSQSLSHPTGETGGVLPRVVVAPYLGSRSSFLLLHMAHAAMVTSGTATLETALMQVPQVVCYAMRCGSLMSWLRKRFLKVPHVSLVNLIVGEEVVPELIAGDMTQERVTRALHRLLNDDSFRQSQKQGYLKMTDLLGSSGAAEKAASVIVQ